MKIVMYQFASLVAAVTLLVFWRGYFIGIIFDDTPQAHRDLPQRDLDQSTRLIHQRRPTPPLPPAPHDTAGPSASDPSSTVIKPDEPCNPTETLRRRQSGDDGRWFNFSKPPSTDFFAFAAFWDDRTTTGSGLINYDCK